MKTMGIILVVAALIMLPVCVISVAVPAWTNSLAWRVMDSIDPNISNDAKVIKNDMSGWLDLHNKQTYEEEYKGGCSASWAELFNAEFCEWDLSDAIKSDNDGDEDGYCSGGKCPAGVRRLNCFDFEEKYKAEHGGRSTCDDLQQGVQCMNGAMIDCNENGVWDEEDKVYMTTCYAQTHENKDLNQWGGDCDCAYSSSHSGYDYRCESSSRMGQKVFTPMSGVIVQIANHGAWGNEVVIYNCGVVMTFGHGLPTKLYKDADLYVGKVVNAMDYVTYMGGGMGNFADDGNSTGAHLDYRSMKCYQDYASGYYGARDFDLSTESIINENKDSEGNLLFDNSSAGSSMCPEFYTKPSDNKNPDNRNVNLCFHG